MKDYTGREIGVMEVARRTRLSPAHISKVFSGNRKPSIRAAALIATALKIPLDVLYVRLVDIEERKSA
jgi:transcriptional regulator with XRE-family HTH domain